MGIVKYYREGFICYGEMGGMCVEWSNGEIVDGDNIGCGSYKYGGSDDKYNGELDWLGGLGGGMGCLGRCYE